MANIFWVGGYFYLLGIICTQKLIVRAYNVASVEYSYGSGTGSTPLKRAISNAESYADIVETIKDYHKEVDLVIFPEATLVGVVEDNREGMEAMSTVPEALDQVIPCNTTNGTFAEYLKLLSCTAQKYRIYLVVNLKEKSPCKKNEECRASGLKYYNTDVVFDREGRIVARYRKYNLFLEGILDRADKPEMVTFQTDFGKTFGIFTCFDVLFESPAMDLVRAGVKDFIFPTFWVPGLPFLTELQVQQMFSQGHDVTLLTAGGSYPLEGSGSVAFYLGKKGALAENHGPIEYNPYLYSTIPEKDKFNPKCNTDINAEKARQMDKYTLLQEDLTNYTYKRLNLDSSRVIEETLYQQDGDEVLRCDFHIEVEIDEKNLEYEKSKYEYFIVSRNGIRYYGNKHYQNNIQVCGLIACSGPKIENCGRRFSNYDDVLWSTTFSSIKISGHFEDNSRRSQYPNSLLADFAPLSPSCTTWTVENTANSKTMKTFSTNVPVEKLLTFAIFGRNYDED